jgi:hypothetical protein
MSRIVIVILIYHRHKLLHLNSNCTHYLHSILRMFTSTLYAVSYPLYQFMRILLRMLEWTLAPEHNISAFRKLKIANSNDLSQVIVVATPLGHSFQYLTGGNN